MDTITDACELTFKSGDSKVVLAQFKRLRMTAGAPSTGVRFSAKTVYWRDPEGSDFDPVADFAIEPVYEELEALIDLSEVVAIEVLNARRLAGLNRAAALQAEED